MNLRLDIQGLRALAVIFVVIFHMQHQWLPGGFIGVDMFFVISGFLISKSIISGVDNKTFNFYKFFEGRVKRIVPNYFFMLLITIVIAAILFIATDFNTFFHQLKRTLLFVSNELFAKTNNYFGAKSFENPLLHTWSLSIEMQFYFFLPLFLYFLPKSSRKFILGFAFLAMLVYTEYNLRIENSKTEMYFSLLARSTEFMIGIAINFAPKYSNFINRFKESLSFFSVLIIFLSAYYIDENSLFPGLLALPACFATAFLIFAENSRINSALSLPLFTYLGKISYSLYLYHWPVLALYRYYKMRYELTSIEIIVLSIIFTLLSIISFYLIEETFRKINGKKFLIYFSLLSLSLFCTWIISSKLNSFFFTIPEVYISPKVFNNVNHGTYSKYELLGAAKTEDDEILMIGDSHGLVMTSFINAVGKENDFNFSYLSTNSVVPLEGIHDSLIGKDYKKSYYELMAISNKLLKESEILIVVKHWQGKDNAYFKGVLEKLIAKLNPDQNLIIVSDFPMVSRNPVREFKAIIKPKDFKNQPISFPEVPKEIKELINKHNNVYLLELKNENFFKNAPFYNDTLMYYDESHLNYYGSVNYADYEGYKLADLIAKIKAKKEIKINK